MRFGGDLVSDRTRYEVADIERLCDEIIIPAGTVKTSKGVELYNCAVSFDIEVSSFYFNKLKRAAMYVWMLGIEGRVVFGRTWDEWDEARRILTEKLGLHTGKKPRHLVIFVHNLSYEFGFLGRRYVWDKIFALDVRKVCYAVEESGIEFRCSYILSGYSLRYLGEKQLFKYRVQKLAGNLDYSKIRHSGTPLTERELDYCMNDAKVVCAYIKEKIENDGDITKIPITKTSYVRNAAREACLKRVPPSELAKLTGDELAAAEAKNAAVDDYVLTMKGLQYKKDKDEDPDMVNLDHAVFRGGDVHVNEEHIGKTFPNEKEGTVSSYDAVSDYPTTLIGGYYPMSRPEWKYPRTPEQFEDLLKTYCCRFWVTLKGVRSKHKGTHVISYSHCKSSSGIRTVRGKRLLDNGRVVDADELTIAVTELDWASIKECYYFGDAEIERVLVSKRGRLPKELILLILEYYRRKTKLKNKPGYDLEYSKAKEDLNSIAGMIETWIIKNEIEYKEGKWREEPKGEANITPSMTLEERMNANYIAYKETEEELKKYNKSRGRFLFYGWAAYITAHARRRLHKLILNELGSDFVYCDTDSAKILNHEKHKQAFEEEYLDWKAEMLYTCELYDIDPEMLEPEDLSGKKQPLGAWDFEGTYDRFKAIGAKRYLWQKKGKIMPTVAGCGKGQLGAWLAGQKYSEDYDYMKEKGWPVADGVDPFERFVIDAEVPAEHTGKLTHTYIDEETAGIVEDYRGVPGEYHEFSSVHMEPAAYSLGMDDGFAEYLLGVKTIYE